MQFFGKMSRFTHFFLGSAQTVKITLSSALKFLSALANKTEESSQSPWVQSDGIKECVIEEVVDITVTGELKEALECLLELLEELCIRRVQHEDFSASLFLPRFPLLV